MSAELSANEQDGQICLQQVAVWLSRQHGAVCFVYEMRRLHFKRHGVALRTLNLRDTPSAIWCVGATRVDPITLDSTGCCLQRHKNRKVKRPQD